jgi:hypothetical protein
VPISITQPPSMGNAPFAPPVPAYPSRGSADLLTTQLAYQIDGGTIFLILDVYPDSLSSPTKLNWEFPLTSDDCPIPNTTYSLTIYEWIGGTLNTKSISFKRTS